MKTIIIIFGLTAGQIQERPNLNLDIAGLYDIDARYLRGPISVRYQVKDAVIHLPESELVSLSFRMGILTSANITPHRRPLDATETAKLCQELNKTFVHHGFTVPETQAKEFKKFTEGLKKGHAPESAPPWRFGWDMGKDAYVTIAIRAFESSSDHSTNSDVKRYTIDLGMSDSTISDKVDKEMDEIRARFFPNRLRVPMSEYPKH